MKNNKRVFVATLLASQLLGSAAFADTAIACALCDVWLVCPENDDAIGGIEHKDLRS
jgi:hypothetical protein